MNVLITELSPIIFYDELKDEMSDERVYNSAKEIWLTLRLRTMEVLQGNLGIMANS
jgi:hypothetical protein